MGLQTEQTIYQRIVSLLLKEGNRKEISLGFTHLAGLII